MSRIKIASALLGGLLTSVWGGGVQAAHITYADFGGGSSFSTQGFDITATGGTFAQKTNGGSFGVGISGDNSVVPGEIDGGQTGITESISFNNTGSPQLLNSFTVAFLYASGAYNDGPNEIATIVINGTAYNLTVTGGNTAEFTGLGLGTTFVQNDSPGTFDNGGQWTVSFLNPFLLQSIVFLPGNGGPDAALGDYAFNQLTTSPVPGPIVGAGLPGLMMALGGLVVLARRRRNQASI